MADGNLDWTTLAWIVGGILVALWVLKRLFRGVRRLVLILVLIGGAVWLTGTGGALSEALLGLGSD